MPVRATSRACIQRLPIPAEGRMLDRDVVALRARSRRVDGREHVVFRLDRQVRQLLSARQPELGLGLGLGLGLELGLGLAASTYARSPWIHTVHPRTRIERLWNSDHPRGTRRVAVPRVTAGCGVRNAFLDHRRFRGVHHGWLRGDGWFLVALVLLLGLAFGAPHVCVD